MMTRRDNLPSNGELKPKKAKAKTTKPSSTPVVSSVAKKPASAKKAAKTTAGKPRQVQSASQTLSPEELHSRIASRAHELYIERCRYGAEVHDWLTAEREILGEV